MIWPALFALPNVIVIFCDDMGIGDVSCYGQKAYRTPHIDRLAREGTRFTNFYVASPACSPSRAAILTGCYPVRVGVPQVLNPDSPTGLNPSETTLAETLKDRGYATACIGKWHLGVRNLLPRAHGFDEFYGVPYSHDMWPPNPNGTWPPLHLFRNENEEEPILTLQDTAQLTSKLTAEALKFMRRSAGKPYFLYLAHPLPHVPLASKRGSKQGLYADVIRDIDDSVGAVLQELKASGQDRNTLIIFSSDNGPWLPYGTHAGSAGIYREGKGTSFEGGFRVPGIFWWPGRVRPQVSDAVASTMDVLPTVAAFSGAPQPKLKIDGHDLTSLLARGGTSPWDEFFYWWPGELQAVRVGDWKLHVPHSHRHQTQPSGRNGKPAGEVTQRIGYTLYNLRTDPSEANNVAAQHPEIVADLLGRIQTKRRELGDTLTGTKGRDARTPGRVNP